jgi:hypothetical protein
MNREKKRRQYYQVKKTRQAEYPLLIVTARLIGVQLATDKSFSNARYLELKREIAWMSRATSGGSAVLRAWGTTTGRSVSMSTPFPQNPRPKP